MNEWPGSLGVAARISTGNALGSQGSPKRSMRTHGSFRERENSESIPLVECVDGDHSELVVLSPSIERCASHGDGRRVGDIYGRIL